MFLLDLRALRAAQRAAELVGKIPESLILVPRVGLEPTRAMPAAF
ncbi:MAG: hypothetical protein XD85_0225 [Parcubacteria bacterium 34_609]|nr:MAG: hypothetical protein XD85_0225 [Parcubacteria bacterium 34_609]